MALISKTLAARLGWTTGAYMGVQFSRLVNNVILARLLAPELFGIMLIVNTLRTGVELLSDIGIGQNIISNKNAHDPLFYDTAWSLQLLRGCGLFVICILAAWPLAKIYGNPTFLQILPAISLFFLFSGAESTARFLVQKRLELKRLSIYELVVSVLTTLVHILLALAIPTIWALVYGGLFSSIAMMIGSYLIIPGIRHRFRIASKYRHEILHFGKWVFASSMIYFLATNFDRLYIGRNVSFQLLGVYGIARSLSDMIGLLVQRLGNMVIFPMIAAADLDRANLRVKLLSGRTKLLIAAALAVSLFVAMSDNLIYLLYDKRYHQAAAMLPVLSAGIWFSVLCALGEATLMGIAKPIHAATGNAAKLIWLVVGLPIALMQFGMSGAVLVIATADLVRFIPLWRAQHSEGLSFGLQDLGGTIAVIGLIVGWRSILTLLGLANGVAGLFALGTLR